MTTTAKKRIIAIAMVGLMLITASCEAEIIELILDFALSWAAENAVDVGKYTFFGSSGNDEVDAIMGAKDVVDDMKAADKLMEEGRKENDLTKMEQAIEKRPGDYTYRVSYGTALLRDGLVGEADDQFAEADDAVLNNYGDYHIQNYATQGIDELGALRPHFEENGFVNKQQCQTYYERMALFYQLRYSDTQSDFFKSQQDHYTALAAGCQ